MKYIDAKKIFKYLEDSIENCYPRYNTNIVDNAVHNVVKNIKDYITSLQQEPEVDLEKEIKNYLTTKCAGDDEPSVSEIARHFYELGINKRKEETK